MRWKITIEYDGSNFHGWQKQDNADSVQQRLEQAVQGFAGKPVIIHGAGRTDAGVHAKGQVAHFDLPDDISQKFAAGGSGNIIGAFTHHLNCPAIAVTQAEIVEDDFDARFSAIQRHYEYNIILRQAPIALMRHYAWQVSYNLDIKAMQESALRFCGKHDFTSFRATACQAKSPVRSLDRFEVVQDDDRLIIYAEARSFLHHQVRNMVGALIACGRKLLSPDDIDILLQACDRSLAPPTAPAHGLCLVQVLYK